MAQNALDRLLTVAELSRLLGVPAKRIRAAIRDGELPSVRIGAWARVRLAWVDSWLRRRTIGRADATQELEIALDHAHRALDAHGGPTGEIRPKQRAISIAIDALADAIDAQDVERVR